MRAGGIASEQPGASSVTSSRSPVLRHIRPLPPVMYQISSTVRCATALETAPGCSVNSAMLPRERGAEQPHLRAVRRDRIRRGGRPEVANGSIFQISQALDSTRFRRCSASCGVPPPRSGGDGERSETEGADAARPLYLDWAPGCDEDGAARSRVATGYVRGARRPCPLRQHPWWRLGTLPQCHARPNSRSIVAERHGRMDKAGYRDEPYLWSGVSRHAGAGWALGAVGRLQLGRGRCRTAGFCATTRSGGRDGSNRRV